MISMIANFLKERLSWILMFILQQAIIVFIAYLDNMIPLQPVLYIVFLSMIAFAAFLVLRYRKETRFYRSLEDWESSLDLTEITKADSPFERLVEDSLIGQTERLKRDASRERTRFELEQDELLSWIHEVKTPLTTMHLIIERMEDSSLKAQLTYEWLRIHLLLDQELHRKRISFIENDLYMEKVSLNALVVGEIRTLKSWCIAKGIGFELQLDMDDVLSDAKWLAFILRQILTNAVKYSDNGEIIVRSYVREDQTVLEITDFGRGIDSRDLPRIFDKGFTSTMEHHDNASTGMGLYLVRRAADPLGIRISVRSAPGEGSTFTLVFSKRNEFVKLSGV